MKSMLKRLTLLAATVVAAAALLAGCSGDDGANGLPGATGATGPAGPAGADGTNGAAGLPGAQGPQGAPGVPGADGKSAAFAPIESCTTCHGTGKIADVATAHASSSTGDIAVTGITTSSSTATDLVVKFNVKINGSNKSAYYDAYGGDGYRLRGDTFAREAVTGITLVSDGSGNYTATIPGGVTTNAGVNSRYLFYVKNTADANLASASRPAGYRAYITFDYPAALTPDLLGSSTACADCHGSFGNGFHRGAPSYGGKTCTVCHDAQNNIAVNSTTKILQTKDMIHGIHNSLNMPTKVYTATRPDGTTVNHTVNGASVPYTYSIAFPSYMSNCSICHQTGAPLTAANNKKISYDICMTCHQDWSGYGDSLTGVRDHTGYTAATNCLTCHDGASIPDSPVTMHNAAKIVTERGGVIYDGADTSVTEGAKINQQITGVTRTGDNLAITWTATYAGTPVNPCNATPAVGVPAFNYTGQNFSILKAFFQGDDLVNANNGNAAPGQPNSTNLSFTALIGNTSCTGNVATTTIALTAKEAALTGNGRVSLQGKPQILFNAAQPATQVRAKSPIYDFALASGASIAARRAVTDTSLCLKCHVGSLYQHGGNRVDNVELCVMCHNEASSDQNNRVAMGVDASEAYDVKGGQTYGFKSMLHAVHSSGETDHKPLVIYRTRGIYAFGPDVAAIPNWPGTSTSETDKKLVYGADPALAISMQPHFFVTAHYPRNLNDCAACHASNFSKIPDQSKAVATTVYTGVAPYDNQLDDTLQGAASAACTSCHQSITVKAHTAQTGWWPSIFEAGRQTIIDIFK